MTRTPRETFHELTDRVGKLAAGEPGQAEALAALYAETTDVSFPLKPAASPLRSRAELRVHTGTVASFRAQGARVHETTDPEVIVAEFQYVVESPRGRTALPHVFIMRVRQGEIVESRDYSAELA